MIASVMYHRITDDNNYGHPITTDEFKAQLKWLLEQGDIVRASDMRKPSDNLKIVLTFDDGTFDHWDAYNILKSFGLSGLFFVNTDASLFKKPLTIHMLQKINRFLGDCENLDNETDKKLKLFFHQTLNRPDIIEKLYNKIFTDSICYINKSEIYEMVRNGMEIGNHGQNHLSNETSESFEHARVLLSEICEIKYLDMPWGGTFSNNKEEIIYLANEYDAVFTTDRGISGDDDFLIKRFDCKDLPPFTNGMLQ